MPRLLIISTGAFSFFSQLVALRGLIDNKLHSRSDLCSSRDSHCSSNEDTVCCVTSLVNCCANQRSTRSDRPHMRTHTPRALSPKDKQQRRRRNKQRSQITISTFNAFSSLLPVCRRRSLLFRHRFEFGLFKQNRCDGEEEKGRKVLSQFLLSSDSHSIDNILKG